MPRRPRLKLPGVPVHIIQRGNNRSACFFAMADYFHYLHHLQHLCEEEGVWVHAYVLMTNHVHLLVTLREAESASQLMKHLGQRYVQYINRTYRRSGTLWEGRFRSCLVDAESYLLACPEENRGRENRGPGTRKIGVGVKYWSAAASAPRPPLPHEECAFVTPADAQRVWTEYLRHRARVRGFDLAVIEHIVRFASERYFDVDTRRMVAIGRHRQSLVLIPYDEDEQTMTPVTIHATTRQQLTFRLQQGRLLP